MKMCPVCENFICHMILTEPQVENSQKSHSLRIFMCSFQKKYSRVSETSGLRNFAPYAKIVANFAKILFGKKPKPSKLLTFLAATPNPKTHH